MKALSIDSEAGAHARYRLVRAMLAAAIAFFLVLLIIFAPLSIHYASLNEALVQTSISVAICTPLLILVALALERLPHQVSGFIGVGASLIALAGPLLIIAMGGSWLLQPTSELWRRALAAPLIALGLPALWLAWDCLLFFGWQFVGEGDLRAVRGWRPKAWRLIANFQRQLGMPAFVATMRGGVLISLVYILSALLNTGLIALPLLALDLGSPTSQSLIAGSEDQYLAFGFAALFLINVLGANRLVAGFAADLARRRYQKVRDWDGRAPVLFLRTFTQDTAKAKIQTANKFLGWLTGIGRRMTLDEILLEHASPYGPVIAIGDPNDHIPPLGAARIFVSHDDWKSVVAGLAGASKAIVMCPTGTEGVRWELDHLVSTGAQARTIYLAGPHLTPEEAQKLFCDISGEAIELSAQTRLIALFQDSRNAWRTLSAKALTTQSYTVALNTALQAKFGFDGVPMKRAARQARSIRAA